MRSHARDDAVFSTLYVAFVFAGVYKSAWYLAWIPVDLTLVFGTLMVAAGGWLVLRERIRLTRAGLALTACFVAFSAYAVVSGLWTPSSEYYLSKAFRLVAVTGLAFGAGALGVASSTRRLRYTGIATTGLAVLTGIESLIEYAQPSGRATLSPFGTNYLITSRLLGLGVLLLVGYLVLSRSDRRVTVAAAVALPGMVFALFATGARGPMVATIVAIGLLLVVGISTGTLPNGVAAIGAYTGGALALGVLTVTVGRQLATVRRLLVLADGPGWSLNRRFVLWNQTIDGLDIGMLPVGHGLGSWPVLTGYGDHQYYPHNLVLEVVFELGLVGLGLLACLFGTALFIALSEWQTTGRSVHLVLLVVFVYLGINAMVTGDVNENRYLFALAGLLAYRADPQRYIRIPGLSRVESNSTARSVRS
ncbi:O-antigen ligase family protein [Saliphagus sp. LR7]|uniref:O-antigen ligase family protein n=1 Tax=Saliphagus sp. LR7 TaxID=2282654 RepID=UPI000DF75258|nr:O-antigen ligase family protein [Saliphagus sp. LR7]